MIELVKSPIVFCEETHRYYLGSQRLSGITSLIHDVLQLGVYPGVSDFVKNVAIPRAGEYGKAVHNAIEMYDTLGLKSTYSQGRFGNWEVSRELESYISNKEGYDSIANEYPVSDNVHYASCIDNVWQKKDTGGIWLVDTKTNNMDYFPGGEEGLKEYLSWQLSVYAWMFEHQNPGLKVEGLACNWLRQGDSAFWLIERKPDDKVELLLSVNWYIDVDDPDEKIIFDGAIVSAQLREAPSVTDVATRPNANLVPHQIVQIIYQIEKQAKESEAIMKEMKEKLRDAMEKACIKSWDSGLFKATIAADSITTTFDTKRFKEDHPDLYEQYTKQTVKKGGFTIKLKD